MGSTEQAPQPESRWRNIVVVAGAVTILAVIGVVMLFGGKSDDDANDKPDEPSTSTNTGLDPEAIAAASARAAKFLDVAGNYGLVDSVFKDPKAAQAADHSTESADYKSRAMVTKTLSEKYFAPTAIFNPYSYKDDASYAPYRVVTEVQVANAAESDFVNGGPSVKVEATLTTHLEFYGETQPYLDAQGNPHQASTVLVDQTYIDTAYVTLIQVNKEWMVHKVDGLDQNRILAFGDQMVFHEDTTLELPEPDEVKTTEVQ